MIKYDRQSHTAKKESACFIGGREEKRNLVEEKGGKNEIFLFSCSLQQTNQTWHW